MGKIKIKKENKGKFTSWAKNHGMSVQQAARHILANREKYSPTLIKRANFARNASKWEEGGLVEFGMGGTNSMQDIGGVIGSIPTPYTQAIGGVLKVVGGIVNASEQKKIAEDARRKQLIDEQNTAQGNIVNQFAPTFKFGGKFKGKKFGGKPNAEVEDGEVVITPDGSTTNMSGKSHSQGGIDVQLPNQSMILSNKVKIGKGQTAADVARPYSTKINKANERMEKGASNLTKNSLKLNMNKYYSKVFDAYYKQEKKKFTRGGKYLYGDESEAPKGSFGNPYSPGEATVIGYRNSRQPFAVGQTVDPTMPWSGSISGYNPADFGDKPMDIAPMLGSLNPMNDTKSAMTYSNPLDAPDAVVNNPFASRNQLANEMGQHKFDWGNALSSIGEMAPMLYNLFSSKPEKINENRYRNYNAGKINSLMANRRYNIDAGLAANESSYRTASANIRNLGGSRGQVMSNIMGAQNTKQFGDMSLYGQKSNMDNQYAGEYANMLYGLGRDDLSSRMMYDETTAMNRAAARNMRASAMTGLQQYLLTRRQMKNQSARDKQLIETIKAYAPNYWDKWVPSLDR